MANVGKNLRLIVFPLRLTKEDWKEILTWFLLEQINPGCRFINYFSSLIIIQKRILKDRLHPMNALSLSVFSTIWPEPFPLQRLLFSRLPRLYPASDYMVCVAVSRYRTFIAAVLPDRSFIEDTSPFHIGVRVQDVAPRIQKR